MGAILVPFLLLCLFGTSTSLRLSYTDCGTAAMHELYRVKEVSQEPDQPSVPGDVTLAVAGEVFRSVDCATFSAKVTYGFKIFGKSVAVTVGNLKGMNICDYLISGECPLVGSAGLQFTKPLPWFTPRKVYDVHITAETCDGQPFACVDLRMDLSGNGNGVEENDLPIS
ncbi:hypothetical protein BSKO_04644 [Bryopsis sp. KO-2023]|nr:hypothetical protein BSKO_04644 [Bryopsis sp. KO-2023]